MSGFVFGFGLWGSLKGVVVVWLCGGRSSSGVVRRVFVLGDDGMMSDMVLRCIDQVSNGQRRQCMQFRNQDISRSWVCVGDGSPETCFGTCRVVSSFVLIRVLCLSAF